MNTKLATKQIRMQQWAATIKDCRASGMTVDDYCRQHGISHDAYYYWLRKVKEAALIQSGFVEITPPEAPETAIPVTLTAKINDVTLEIKEGVSSEFLANVIRVIRNA